MSELLPRVMQAKASVRLGRQLVAMTAKSTVTSSSFSTAEQMAVIRGPSRLFPLSTFMTTGGAELLQRDAAQDEQYARQHQPILEKWNKEAEQALRSCQVGDDLIDEWCGLLSMCCTSTSLAARRFQPAQYLIPFVTHEGLSLNMLHEKWRLALADRARK